MSRNRSENQTEIINFELFTIIEKQNAGGGGCLKRKEQAPSGGNVNASTNIIRLFGWHVLQGRNVLFLII